ncbi:MFS transporter [Actinokineospora auranticolor]|uniref:Putative MFS family arabinose efflux permease n=1 Tax=Actinokineospora auranticolor TaxID=155976 RepID=A0A2S6GKZ5_9PSEU|nr:MFS transporter [Actinokineospora auranticolor]PPK65853.1 putative MFS family arabinose efflux permease [Actinokineospora auranticolor]
MSGPINGMQQYRRMLGLPGVRTLVILMFFARIPLSAASIVLTLHVAVGLGRGYGDAGLVGMAATIGIAVGAPLMGMAFDRYGLRPIVLAATVVETAFWTTAPHLPYPVLLPVAFVGGLLALPVMSIGRQAVAALVPEPMRRSAYSLDSISVELSFMIGPAVAVLLTTRFSTTTAATALGCGVAAVGLALAAVNPKVRAEHEEQQGGPRLSRRQWLTPELIRVFAVGGSAVFVLAGIDVTMVAALRAHGELDWAGLLIAVICTASAVGGLVHGVVKRSLPQVVLMALLGALTIPVGLFVGQWWVLALALIPCCVMCAPTIAATGEEVARLAPPAARGEATGLQSSALTLGGAAGAPVVGFVVDHSSPGWGFAMAGAGGLLIALVATVLGAVVARPRGSVEAADGDQQAQVVDARLRDTADVEQG